MKTVKQRWKAIALTACVAAGLGCPTDALAAKNVMCLKTDAGQYIEVVRVSMMVIPDGGNTFEIVVKDGEGATNVSEISFEKHASDIDLSKYQGTSGQSDNTDWSKPVFLLTSNGKYFKLKELPVLNAKDGSDKIDVVVGGVTEPDVAAIYFYRGDESGVVGIDSPASAPAVEELRLQTPVSSQLFVSGCDDAVKALVYALDGKQVAEAPVANGTTTIQVSHLRAGAYILKVGKKSLKFIKK